MGKLCHEIYCVSLASNYYATGLDACIQMQSQGPVSSSHYLLYLFSQRQCMLSHWCRDFSRNEDIIMTPAMMKKFIGLGILRISSKIISFELHNSCVFYS